jgi:hypothetical protein
MRTGLALVAKHAMPPGTTIDQTVRLPLQRHFVGTANELMMDYQGEEKRRFGNRR